MPSLQYLIDSMCANFTAQSLQALVKEVVAVGPCTMLDIAQRVTEKDPSLDLGSARLLAEAAVQILADRGEVAVCGERVWRAGG
ncbi:MAG: hypothetical protein ACK4K2_02235 [Dehalococcoidia bacterium]